MVSWVLKEWQVAVAALLKGDTILLLRKGGIREASGQFSLAARDVLLLPTMEHQIPDLVKPAFQPLIEPAALPDPIAFAGWATITHAFVLNTASQAAALVPHLVWNERFVAERLTWQPDRPLYGLLLRAYRLSSPLVLPRHRGYSGCRSWVEIGQSVTLPPSVPALSAVEYQAQVDAVLATVPTATRVDVPQPTLGSFLPDAG